ncbi:MAG: 6-phospho-beta-glucosidase [Chloroflexota bacterium]|nr:MAG: 6-phospho-beta-glucosidase [Chloroflexota bacterium]
MKIAVIGGGSSYTPELINGFLARRETLPVSELWLMDVLPERLEIVGGFARRMVEAAGSPFTVHLTGDQREAVRGASYVLTQLRVGWMAARREDEYLGKRHGLLGQETTGVGGMAKALRTIPVILRVANDIRELAPGALLVNFTNPAGLITEALQRYAPEVTSIGLCNVPITTSMNILKRLGLDESEAPRARLDTLGLNHLTWHRGFTLDGEDLWPQVLKDYIERQRAAEKPEFDPRTIEALGMIPNGYVGYYYYTEAKIAQQDQWPPSRAERVMEIEEALLAQYAEPDRVTPPEGLMQRGGAYYSTLATQVLEAHHNDTGEIHVVNTRHNGAVSGWPADWVLEMPCRIDAQGVHPLPAEPLPPAPFGLLAAVKAYELLTVEAAVHGDRNAAYQALLVHPLGPSADQVEAVLNDMLETNRRYLPQFFPDEA